MPMLYASNYLKRVNGHISQCSTYNLKFYSIWIGIEMFPITKLYETSGNKLKFYHDWLPICVSNISVLYPFFPFNFDRSIYDAFYKIVGRAGSHLLINYVLPFGKRK